MIREVGGLGLGGPRGKGSPSISKGPKPPIQQLQLLKNSKKSKKGPFCYILGPPGPSQEMELMGPGGEGPSRSPPVSPAMCVARLCALRTFHWSAVSKTMCNESLSRPQEVRGEENRTKLRRIQRPKW